MMLARVSMHPEVVRATDTRPKASRFLLQDSR